MTPRQKIIHSVVGNIMGLPQDSILRVGIDGDAGAGKSTFGDELQAALSPSGRPVIRASVDSFHNPREIRYRLGKSSPEGFFQDSHNYGLLKTCLLTPLSPGGSGCFRRTAFDHRADAPVSAPEECAAPGSILVFDGIFLHRPELSAYWDYSVFLDVTPHTGLNRCAMRGDGSPDPLAESNRRYVEGWRIYMAECSPKEIATMVVSNEDFENPVITSIKQSGKNG